MMCLCDQLRKLVAQVRPVGRMSLEPWPSTPKKLSLVEQNYDIGNRELLAIKLVIEVWRHWFAKPKDSIPNKPSGPYSSLGSTLQSLAAFTWTL